MSRQGFWEEASVLKFSNALREGGDNALQVVIAVRRGDEAAAAFPNVNAAHPHVNKQQRNVLELRCEVEEIQRAELRDLDGNTRAIRHSIQVRDKLCGPRFKVLLK